MQHFCIIDSYVDMFRYNKITKHGTEEELSLSDAMMQPAGPITQRQNMLPDQTRLNASCGITAVGSRLHILSWYICNFAQTCQGQCTWCSRIQLVQACMVSRWKLFRNFSLAFFAILSFLVYFHIVISTYCLCLF